jgi:crotonobetainyl-CoA:carnitine CoA-transferase CaiB-like acyl-CoA transferase
MPVHQPAWEARGRLEQFGTLFGFSATPAVIAGPRLVVGDSTDSVLTGVGYTQYELDALRTKGMIA